MASRFYEVKVNGKFKRFYDDDYASLNHYLDRLDRDGVQYGLQEFEIVDGKEEEILPDPITYDAEDIYSGTLTLARFE